MISRACRNPDISHKEKSKGLIRSKAKPPRFLTAPEGPGEH